MKLFRKISTKNIAVIIFLVIAVSVLLRGGTEFGSGSRSARADNIYKRAELLKEACSRMPSRRNLRASVSGKRLFYLAEKYSLSYCKVPEAGSLFWTKSFLTLAGVNPQWHDYGDAKTMFDISKSDAASAIKRRASLTMTHDDERIHKTISFLVARNPYSRLFAAYIDMIYLPTRWYAASKMVQGAMRQECGSDVTFNEFLTSVANTLLKRRFVDLNWAPIFTLCLPCDTGIDIIAKQETFSEDADFILGYVGVENEIKELIAQASIYKQHNKNDLLSQIRSHVAKGHSANRGCISEEKLAERIWTAFQIKGYIHDDLKFPRDQFKSVLRDDLEDVLTDLVLSKIDERFMTDEIRDIQRHNWQVHFWKTVSKETIHDVQAAYYEDFVLFDYDIDPNSM